PDDRCARFGGDEFVVLLAGATRREASAIADDILARVRGLSYVERDRVLHVQCSVGISIVQSDRFAAHEVLAQADMACREAKATGRNRKQVYKITKRQNEQILSDVGWAARLRTALAEGGLELEYQPILHVKTGRVMHHEALLRL